MTGVRKEVWSVVEAVDGRPHDTAAKLASEARRLGRLLDATPVCVVTDRLDDRAAACAALGQHGAEKVLCSQGDESEAASTAEAVTARLAALVAERQPHAVLFAATREGAERAARLAARLRAGLAARCIDFELDGGTLVARRTVSGGKAHAMVEWAGGPPYLATVELASLEAVADGTVTPAVEEVGAAAAAPRAEHRRRWRLAADELDLTEAAFIISVGKPVDTPAKLARVEEVAARLGASIGGSRISFFQGIIPKARQVGASGKWVAPTVYVTLGISGASYHVMGIKGAKHIVAVNSDRDAPIFKLAEVGIVADLEDVVTALLEATSGSGAVAPAGGAEAGPAPVGVAP